MIKYPCKTNFWAELVKLSPFSLWMTWSFGSLDWLSAAKLQRTCDRSSSLARSWLIARDWVECDYVECCSSKRGDHILITLFRDGFCSLLYKRGLGEKKRSSGLCCGYLLRAIPPKAAGRKLSIYFQMPVAWLFVDCKKDAFRRGLQQQFSSSVCQVP